MSKIRRREWWSERKRLQWKIKHGLRITEEELSSAREIEELVKLLQFLKTEGTGMEKEPFLRTRAGKVLCDLILEIVDSKGEPTCAEEIAFNLLSINSSLMKSSGYSSIVEKIMGDVLPKKFVNDLLNLWREKPESLERTTIRLLSKDERFIKVERDLFVLRDWIPNKLFQIYVRLASEYRVTNPKKKGKLIHEAIKLLETGKADFPNKNELIETLKRM